jgi:hypothetical protein
MQQRSGPFKDDSQPGLSDPETELRFLVKGGAFPETLVKPSCTLYHPPPPGEVASWNVVNIEGTRRIKTSTDNCGEVVDPPGIPNPFFFAGRPFSLDDSPAHQAHTFLTQGSEVGLHETGGNFYIVVHVNDGIMPGVHPSVVPGRRQATERNMPIVHQIRVGLRELENLSIRLI